MKHTLSGALLASIILTACSIPATVIEDTAATVESGVVEEAVISANFTILEIQTVRHGINKLEYFMEAYAIQPIMSDDEAYYAYGELRKAFWRVEQIVMAHWDEYPLHKQNQIRVYQAQAKLFDKAVRTEIALNDSTVAFNAALNIGDLLLKVIKL